MKTAGFVLALFGGLMVLSSVNIALTHNLNSSHDVSKLFGGLAIAVLVLLASVLLIQKANAKK